MATVAPCAKFLCPPKGTVVGRRQFAAVALLSSSTGRPLCVKLGHSVGRHSPGPAAAQLAPKAREDSMVMHSKADSTAENGEGLPPLAAVIWDIDNTLADSTSLAYTATNRVLASRGLPEIDMAGYLHGTQFTTPRRLALHATGDTEDPLGTELGAQFDELYIGLVSRETAGFYPGLEELLADLSRGGVRLGALSNACGEYVREVLSANGVSGSFEVQLGADEVPAAKPAPDGLLQCADALGLSPSECVYIGDAPSDGKAAQAAGMQAVGVSWGAHGEAQLFGLFDSVVADVGALREALRTMGVAGAAEQTKTNA